jgi:hypothetical protein
MGFYSFLNAVLIQIPIQSFLSACNFIPVLFLRDLLSRRFAITVRTHVVLIPFMNLGADIYQFSPGKDN